MGQNHVFFTIFIGHGCLVTLKCHAGGENYQEVQGKAVKGEVPLQYGTANGYNLTLLK